MGVIEEMARSETEELVNDCQIERELEIDELREENAKLRELVADMWHELDAATQYDAGGSRGVVFEYLDTMRELGIEVVA